MSKGVSGNRCVYICRTGNGSPHVSQGAVFSTLESALAALDRSQQTARSDGQSADSDPSRLEIACVDGQEGTERRISRPRHRFYFDTHLLGLEGDGTERDPWPDIPTALKQLESRYRRGELELGHGQAIVLERREIFTTTRHERRKELRERIAGFIFMAMSMLLVAPLLAILGYLVYMAWPALTWEFLTANPENRLTAGGIWAPLIGTFFLVLFSLAVAAPIGILAGVYLNEYAGDNWFTRVVNLAVVNLAGVPSIVHALFGVGAFVLAANMGESLLAASCTLAVMTLPVIITSTREALAAVPMAFREACWNMGASRWQTIRTIVLPNSIAGILTGVILQVSRAAGETAPILFTGATLYMRVADTGWESYVPYGPWDKVMALSMHLFALMTQVANAPSEIVYGTAVVLIGLVLAVNSASIALRVWLRSRKKW